MRAFKLALLTVFILLPSYAEASSMLMDRHGNIYTAGQDSVVCHTPDGNRMELARFDSTVLDLAISRQGSIFALDANGVVWMLPPEGGKQPVGRSLGNAKAMTVDRDGNLILGNENGEFRTLRP
jgi:sugar lactone lactonase YvrE